LGFTDKYEYYHIIKDRLEINGFKVHDYEEINYGLQFIVEFEEKSHLYRVFESKKKGVSSDLSLIKDAKVIELINKVLEELKEANNCSKKLTEENIQSLKNPFIELKSNLNSGLADVEENPIIGIDESGKGDYFGPLVIAGVYADENMKKKLKELGVDDSKKLSDKRVSQLAEKIKETCRVYDLVIIGNQKYNELHSKLGNLNKLLAWGHARVIENILNFTECNIALSDQFGNPELIKNALMDKGKNIHLEQRPKAEQNVVVAAASILARNEFVEKIKKLNEKYNLEFTKGVSNKTVEVGKAFVKQYGKESLSDVAKLHFKTTAEILE